MAPGIGIAIGLSLIAVIRWYQAKRNYEAAREVGKRAALRQAQDERGK